MSNYLERLNDRDLFATHFGEAAYDWSEAFAYATGFTIRDVAEVKAYANGHNDEDNWIGVFLLKDGRWAWLTAGCDYTGWDCQASGESHICDTLPELILGFVGEENAKRLGLPMPEKP